MASRRTIYKWFWVWDFEKEEEWLNEMAMNGWVLESVGFCSYHFIRCEPGNTASAWKCIPMMNPMFPLWRKPARSMSAGW